MATIPISALPESTGLTGVAVPGVQGGITTKSSSTLSSAQVITALGFTPAPINDPIFTGNPRAPTPSTGDNSTSLATTAFVKNQGYVTAVTAPVTSVATKTGAVTLVVGDVSGAAPLASPTFTGVPAGPTAAPGTNTTQLATTAFVTSAGFQGAIQYQNQGSNVGTAGSETIVNFTGAGVVASITGATLSITIAGGFTSPLNTKGDLLGFSTVNARLPVGTNAQVVRANSAQTLGVEYASLHELMAFSLDGGGTTIPVGTVSHPVRITGNWTVVLSTLFLDPGASAGSVVLDILVSSFASYPSAVSIVAAAPPTLSSAIKSQDSVLSGWTVNLLDGRFYWIKVTSISGITSLSLNLALVGAI